MTLLHIVGTDGAGKTTVTRRLVEEGIPGRRVRYLYCQHRPFFLWLMKLPARLLFLRRENAFKDYAGYKSRKHSVIQRHPWLGRLYVRLWYFDVWLQTWPRMLWARAFADVVLVDRYYLDWVVNLGVFQDNSLDAMLAEARRLEKSLPPPQAVIFLDVSEETAFARKDDIQSPEYLRERKARYRQLADAYDFRMVNANRPLPEVLAEVRACVRGEVGRKETS
ncbi:MAG TPA: hypothetical protein VEB66_14530 [Opitutaceae bacterium]|nr:hypothetical protein [Opitutaceae bacterium]